MPAKGKHRRPKARPLGRGLAAAGTGGAALALPLIGATGAHAAQQAAPEAPAPVQQRAAAKPVAQVAAKAPAKTRATTYTVVSGDYLSKIAEERRLSGGWQKLYEDNRTVVGGDPSLILPGMKLTLGAKAPAGAAAPKAERTAPKEQPRPSAPQASDDSDDSSGATRSENTRTSARGGGGSGFTAPVDAGVTTPYRASGGMWSSGYHTGVDFSASSGTPVHAVGQGTVVSAGWGGAYGNQVVIRHADGNYSQYAHLSSLSVSAGQSVGEGDRIGLSGSTGNVTGPHLHFEMRTSPDYGSDIDPVAYLRQHGASL
ncbi:LysM peptidoglycan-binding domain-containing M23 family metallopeptidase [Streptomyces sp. NPDC001941]|uniref:M23 family metallopeptidase n=1 Tax=Streptomyces sp. NPDC001941 TaxID=3154659 RepID=UPI00332FFE2A